ALEILVGHDVAEFAATLDEQQFVDRTQNQLRRAFGNRLLQLRAVGGDVLQFGALPEKFDLHPLEIALGHNVPVHLDEDLLENFAMERNRETESRERGGRDDVLDHLQFLGVQHFNSAPRAAL